MSAQNDFKRLFDQRLAAKLVLAAARLRFAALVDFLVAPSNGHGRTVAEIHGRTLEPLNGAPPPDDCSILRVSLS